MNCLTTVQFTGKVTQARDRLASEKANTRGLLYSHPRQPHEYTYTCITHEYETVKYEYECE